MRCSINIPNLGDFADPPRVAEAARLAEEAGWDGVFVWDHLIGYNRDLVSEWAVVGFGPSQVSYEPAILARSSA